MSPFDRVLMTCYSTLIETVRLSCAVFEAVVRRKSPIFFNPPHVHLAPRIG